MTARLSILLTASLIFSATSFALGYDPGPLSGPLSDPLSEHELNAVRVSQPGPDRSREDWCPRYLQAVFLAPRARQIGGRPEYFPDAQGSSRAAGLVALGQLFGGGPGFPGDQAVVDYVCYEVRLVSDVFEPEEASLEEGTGGATTREMAFPNLDVFLPRVNPSFESSFFLSPLVGLSGPLSILSTNQPIPFPSASCNIVTGPHY